MLHPIRALDHVVEEYRDWPAPMNDATCYVSPVAYAAVDSRPWYRGQIASGAGGR